MQDDILVSCTVVSYNSADTVIETLESIKAQTYQNIELIVSDDCSTDNTVEFCRDWIAENKKRFVRTVLLTVDKNTGVSGNCNRGLGIANGKWIKFLAGDDMLAPTAITDYIDYVIAHPNVRHMIAKSVHFTGQLQESDLSNFAEVSPYLYRDEISVKYQYKVIRRMFFGSGPTYFAHIPTLRSVGGYDVRFPMQEDYPLIIKMIGAGYKMMIMDKVTVYYREGNGSISHDKDKGAIFTKNQVRIVRDYKYKYREETLGPLWKVFHYYSLWIQMAIIYLGNSYKSKKCRVLNFIYRVTDPFLWYTRYIQSCERAYLRNKKR